MIKAIKYGQNPIFRALLNKNRPAEGAVYNPAAAVLNNKLYLFYRSEQGYERRAIGRIKVAVTNDGWHFTKLQKDMAIWPQFKDETAGCEDPRIIKIPGTRKYFMTYTAYQGIGKHGDVVNLRGAFSDNLMQWKKTEPLLRMEKSGAIVNDYQWKGQYLMYIGGDGIRLAMSKDLKTWTLLKKPVLLPRKGNYFDNRLVETGPPPIVCDRGIMVIYNGKDDKQKFSVGVAIFDKNNPAKIIYRQREPLLEPTEYWEQYGKINNVVFATGLVKFKNKWLIYYGGADKSIGVAELKF